MTQYHVQYVRSDGHNIEGVDVPYAFDGGLGGTVSGDTTVGFTLVRNQEPALVDDQSRGGVSFLEQLLKHGLELLDVFLDELGQSGHVMRIAAWTG